MDQVDGESTIVMSGLLVRSFREIIIKIINSVARRLFISFLCIADLRRVLARADYTIVARPL